MDIVWQWTDLAEAQPPAQSVIPNPENYTLTFLRNNELSIKADCNMVRGDLHRQRRPPRHPAWPVHHGLLR